MLRKRWVFPQVDLQRRHALATLLSVSPLTAALLLARGVTNKAEADRWLLASDLPRHDPFLIPDLGLALERLHRAVSRRERICFYGDYDVDGTTATSTYVLFFREIGADVRWYIPHRLHEGYGLNEQAIRFLAADGVTLVVTSDCGTTSHREIDLARRLGLDVIVTDHHQTDALPDACAVLNPHRADSRYPFKHLCSAALAWKVVQGYAQTYEAGACLPDSFLDLVALATIADVVPLEDENRSMVRQGLLHLSTRPRPGLLALQQVAGVSGPCTAATAGFRLAPRINAAGRLAHADLAVQLMTTDSESVARRVASELDDLNSRRQQLEEQMTAEALRAVGEGPAPPAIVVASPSWHLGVVGIVAARLVERLHRPAVVLAVNEAGIAKGSARSLPGFDLYRALGECADLLLGFGGHPSAAGLTLNVQNFERFVSRFNAVAEGWAGQTALDPLLHLDAEVKLMDVGPRVIREFDLLHPFGEGNPEPILAVRHVRVLEARTVGTGHLKLVVRQGHSLPFEGIGFRFGSLTDQGLGRYQTVDLAFTPDLQRWKGLDRVQLRIRDIRPSVAHEHADRNHQGH